MSESSSNKTVEFDADWYCKTYPDVEKSGLEPSRHYRDYGIRLGRKPSLEAEPRSPIVVLQTGANRTAPKGRVRAKAAARKAHDRFDEMPRDGKYFIREDLQGTKVGLYPAPCFEALGHNINPYPESACFVTPQQSKKPARIESEPNLGLHLHLHYVDLLGDMVTFLANIPFKYSLYVSITDASQQTHVEQLLAKSLPQAAVLVRCFENKGRDIAAFICGFGKELSAHDYIAHIHTKRSPHNQAKADWRRQLMTYLMGSESIVSSIFRRFETSKNLGMVFPVFHHSLHNQISWGTNYPVCEAVASRMNIDIDPDRMMLFPAGSMFWARTDALRPLLECGLGFADFPEEQGQVDGTPAHGIERLFGEVVSSQGFDLLQTRPDKPFNLLGYYPAQWPYQEPEDIARRVSTYLRKRKKNNRIAVFTALSGGYERPVIHESLDPSIDYIIYTDGPLDDRGFWDVRPMDWFHPEPVRMARRIKTCPHIYLQDYDWAIWVDANVVIRGDVLQYLKMLMAQEDMPLAGIPHPLRRCAYLEAKAVVKSGRDTSGRAQRQMQEYDAEGYPTNQGLIESNFMVLNLRNPATTEVMSEWWSQLNRYSHRDQLSLNYSLWKTGHKWLSLMDENRSLRDNPDFAYLGHGRNSGYQEALVQPDSKISDPYAPDRSAKIPDARVAGVNVDIVVCVHNALDVTRDCLNSVVAAMRAGDRVIVVDDASDAPTADWLLGFTAEHNALLLRNDGPADGYCKAANKGMAASEQDYFLLLNSDTVLTRDALENMLRTAVRHTHCGLVGPMSNAASSQSIPEIKGTAAQTAINSLPAGQSIEDMNRHCETWSHPTLRPAVPLVHGFCQLISRAVFERIGGFDEDGFPQGYGEENDFCLRAADAGFDLRIATDAYVFHVKSASYTDDARRQELMSKGSQKLKEKHTQDRVTQAVKMMEGNPLLVSMREQSRVLHAGGQ